MVHQLNWRKRLLLLPLAWLVGLWLRTLRFHFDEEADTVRRDLPRCGTIFAFWHNHLFIAPELHRRARREAIMHGLISASRDGAWLAAFFDTLGIRPIRGSQHQRGIAGTREMIRILRQEGDLGITPDGSVGPCYLAKAGVLSVAKASGAPILLFGATFHRTWRLRTWDGFFIPLPFSRIDLRLRFFSSADEIPGATRDEKQAAITAILRELSGESMLPKRYFRQS
jgi:lysophospholipid acyltransferase (LPLAT)-like uncharacterized protein